MAIVSLAGCRDVTGADAAPGDPGAGDVAVDDVAGVGAAAGVVAVGKLTLSCAPEQPAIPPAARVRRSVQTARLLIPHVYRIRSGHACHCATGPRMD